MFPGFVILNGIFFRHRYSIQSVSKRVKALNIVVSYAKIIYVFIILTICHPRLERGTHHQEYNQRVA